MGISREKSRAEHASRTISRSIATASREERIAFYQKVYSLFFIGFAVLAAFAGLGLELVKRGFLSQEMVFGLILVEVAIVWFGMGKMKSKKAGLSLMFTYAAISGLTFGPLLCMAVVASVAQGMAPYAMIVKAFALTSLSFGGLTAYVFITKKDFSYLGGFLSMAFMGVIGFVALSWIGLIQITSGIDLIFSVAMIALLSLDVLYTTSKIQHYYGPKDTVIAAFELLISFALMLWYILRLLILLSSD